MAETFFTLISIASRSGVSESAATKQIGTTEEGSS